MDESFTIGGLTLRTDARPADWAVEAARNFNDNVVGCLVPPVFAAYARVFHPARRENGEQAKEVSWAEVAEANGRLAHPAMQWPSITGSWRFVSSDDQPGLWDNPPQEGSLPVRQAARLARILTAYTATPEQCWFAVWEGFGGLGLPVEDEEIPRVEMPARPMLLLSGPLSAATTSFSATSWLDQRAGLWWPQDRTWCVATDVDLMTTYVGGTDECVATLVADEELEAMKVGADHRLAWDGDSLNPPPADQRQ
ncbi:hypothetical protein OG884_13085 [Streptosporangium sp. NBC_01755]|uniref:hypothetical protein n=1 Tax=unclassified Streptosporangium TaxID=2632669 RepID=UPI002DDA0D68|nr:MULTISPECIES: hypothetical protein [unclassified Streptosporangium]WSA25820.1 hypothetical protein OIE13_33780 [Streptosporangium sp. NBC_01810]WSD02789.1 hypothetical protein OG884_13085 [Streptosporangium sp. NBC_01755]